MNKKRIVWLIPVLALAFVLAGCSSDDDDGGIGDNLSIPGEQVYNPDGTLYTGGIPSLANNVGGSGSIKDGKMSFSVGVPNKLNSMETFISEMDEMLRFNVFSYAEWQPGETKAIALKFTISLSEKADLMNTPSKTMKRIYYIFVDRDCTVTATEISPVTYAGISVPVSDINLRLKRGWNRVGMVLWATAGGHLVIGTEDLDNCKWVLE